MECKAHLEDCATEAIRSGDDGEREKKTEELIMRIGRLGRQFRRKRPISARLTKIKAPV